MRKYLTFFRLRMICGLQYRAAALAGIATQFAWGFMLLLMFRAFYRSSPGDFPMEFSQLASYIWLQQAFLALFASWSYDSEAIGMIIDGNVACELCRPCDLYTMWFVKNLATRVSRAALRCLPILLVTWFLPEPFRMNPPAGGGAFALFLVSMLASALLVIAFSMLAYSSVFYTLSFDGLRLVLVNVIDLLSGALIPLAFFPPVLTDIVGLLPFASMQNTPFMIYNGALSGAEALGALALQLFWLGLFLVLGRLAFARASSRVVAQGG